MINLEIETKMDLRWSRTDNSESHLACFVYTNLLAETTRTMHLISCVQDILHTHTSSMFSLDLLELVIDKCLPSASYIACQYSGTI